jgi:hypothetical protein
VETTGAAVGVFGAVISNTSLRTPRRSSIEIPHGGMLCRTGRTIALGLVGASSNPTSTSSAFLTTNHEGVRAKPICLPSLDVFSLSP